jgi:hypothetical protein
LAREVLCVGVAFAGEGVHLLPPVPRYLYQDVGRRAETVEAYRFTGLQQPIGAIADQARTQQRRRLLVAVLCGNRKAVGRGGDGVLGKASVDLVPGIARLVTEVFPAVGAVPAVAATAAQPRHAHALAGSELRNAIPEAGNFADDLVAGYQRQVGMREIAIEHMQIGAADAAGCHAQ